MQRTLASRRPRHVRVLRECPGGIPAYDQLADLEEGGKAKSYRKMRLDMCVVNRNAPTHFTCTMCHRIMIRPASYLPQTFAHGREVYMGCRGMPPCCRLKTWVKVLDLVPTEQRTPYRCACELDFIFGPCRIANNLLYTVSIPERMQSLRG